MSKIQIALCTVALVAIPLGIQQVAMANLEDEERELTQQLTAVPLTKPSSGPSGGLQPGNTSESDSAEAVLAELKEQADAAAKIGLQIERSQAKAKVKALVEALGLDEDRAAAIDARALRNVALEKERWSRYLKALGASGSLEEVEQAGAASKEIGLFDGIEADLDGEQLERYEEWVAGRENAEMRKLAERQTYQDLEELQQVLQLTDEKKQKAFEILSKENEATFLAPDEELPEEEREENYFEEQIRQGLQKRLQEFGHFLTEEELRVYQQYLEGAWEMELE